MEAVLDYQKRLQAIEPNVNFLMSLYLHPDITPDTIKQAKKDGITGVKSYPAGVTTNSASGVVDYESFYPVFAEMERQDMILNLHGESPSTADSDITVLNAEERFLPTLKSLHEKFPKLRIILEHCTTAKAVQAVKECGDTVAATITAHHLFLTIDNVVADPFCFCKPGQSHSSPLCMPHELTITIVAKTPADRNELLRTVVSGHPKFFLGTDSAPHPAVAKRGGEGGKDKAAAGVFTQPYATQTVLDALEEGIEQKVISEGDVTNEKLEGFLSGFGRAFYRVADSTGERIVLKRKADVVLGELTAGSLEVVPFRRGQKTWKVEWK